MKTVASVFHEGGKDRRSLTARGRFRTLWVVLILALWLPATPAPAAEPTWPVNLPVEDFGATGGLNAQAAMEMSAEEVTAFERAVAGMPRFPAYFYSGCHDRAHAAYLLIPVNLRSKVRKIWVVGPARFTAAIAGTIGLRRADAAASAVSWGYHVALAIDTGNGMRVYDPALHPEGTISRQQWFDMMTIPRFAFWTVTSGSVYLFNYANLSAPALNGSEVWNGNANFYQFLSESDRIMPDNLARDAVGVQASAGNTCPELIALATNPQGLLTFLRSGSAAPAACQTSVTLFNGERERWRRLLH